MYNPTEEKLLWQQLIEIIRNAKEEDFPKVYEQCQNWIELNIKTNPKFELTDWGKKMVKKVHDGKLVQMDGETPLLNSKQLSFLDDIMKPYYTNESGKQRNNQ